jgi:pimeloyl-ACP methyl ester carboxylesterase
MILPHDDAGTGGAVILLHAGIADRTMWDEHLPPLAAAGFRAVAVDLPGFGDAPVATGEQAPWLDVLATMDTLEIDGATLVGSSFGGAVALRVALVAPERIRALALVSAPAPGLDPSAELLSAWEAEEAALERGDLDGAVEAILTAWLQPGAAPGLRDRIARSQHRALAKQADADETPEAPDPLDDAAAALVRITMPALVLVGEHDMEDFHASAEVLARALSCDGARTIPGAGHLAPLEQPDAFLSALLEFLSDGRSAGTKN